MSTQLLLVRHGESEWNALRKLQGQKDISLSIQGQQQAQRLAPIIQAYSPETVIASDLKRATQTATLLGYTPERLEPRWREAHLGDWEGIDIQTLRDTQNDDYRAWRDGQHDPPGAEGFIDFCERIRLAIQDLETSQRRVLVVTHGGVVRATLKVLFGIGPDRIVPVSPASLTVIDLLPTPRLRAYNITSTEALLDPPD